MVKWIGRSTVDWETVVRVSAGPSLMRSVNPMTLKLETDIPMYRDRLARCLYTVTKWDLRVVLAHDIPVFDLCELT